MTTETNRAAAPGDRRAAAEALLARYPDLSEDEIADLCHWFRKEAGALETGMIASDDRLRQPYEQFRSDHLDRLGPRAQAIVWLVGVLLFASLAALALTL